VRWPEDPLADGDNRPRRWPASLLAAAGLGVALVGGLTVTSTAGGQRDAPAARSVLETDPATEPTGRAGLPHGGTAPPPSPVTTPQPAAPTEPPAVPAPATILAPVPLPAPQAETVAVGSPGRDCSVDGSTAVTDTGRSLVCTARGGGRLRWRLT